MWSYSFSAALRAAIVSFSCVGPDRGQRVRRCGDTSIGGGLSRRPAALHGTHAARLSRRATDPRRQFAAGCSGCLYQSGRGRKRRSMRDRAIRPCRRRRRKCRPRRSRRPCRSERSTPPGTGMKRPSDAAAIAALKCRAILQPVADGAAGDAHAERAGRLADGDVGARDCPSRPGACSTTIWPPTSSTATVSGSSPVGARLQRAVDDLLRRGERHAGLKRWT